MNTRTANPTRPAPKESNFPARTIRAFLAEDSPRMMALLARMVSQDPRVWIVGSATNGRNALCNAATLAPDLIIMDLNMPGMHWTELMRRMKSLPNPPIVLATTVDNSCEVRDRCLASGADGFVVKSGNLATSLLSAIQEHFPDDHTETQNSRSVSHYNSDGRRATVANTRSARLAQARRRVHPCSALGA